MGPQSTGMHKIKHRCVSYRVLSHSDQYDAIEGILRFASTQLSDEGWYTCTAVSGHETNSTRLYLTVKSKP